MSTEWLTVSEVLVELGISEDTWKKWRLRRVAPPAKRLPNGSLRIRRGDLDRWLDGLDAA
jgi:hypothetical protein